MDGKPNLQSDRFGETYSHDLDFERLNKQQKAVYSVMQDGKWHTLSEVSKRTGAPEASVSARLRDLRNIHGLNVERKRRAAGLWHYRLAR